MPVPWTQNQLRSVPPEYISTLVSRGPPTCSDNCFRRLASSMLASLSQRCSCCTCASFFGVRASAPAWHLQSQHAGQGAHQSPTATINHSADLLRRCSHTCSSCCCCDDLCPHSRQLRKRGGVRLIQAAVSHISIRHILAQCRQLCRLHRRPVVALTACRQCICSSIQCLEAQIEQYGCQAHNNIICQVWRTSGGAQRQGQTPGAHAQLDALPPWQPRQHAATGKQRRSLHSFRLHAALPGVTCRTLPS